MKQLGRGHQTMLLSESTLSLALFKTFCVSYLLVKYECSFDLSINT